MPRKATPATAYHEAGHAVAAYFFGIPFRKKGATVIPNEDQGFSGCVHTSKKFGGQRPDMDKTDAARLRCERHAMVSLAGMEAQRKFSRPSIRNYHGHHDYLNAVDLMSYFFFEEKVLDANLEFLRMRMVSLFDNHPYAWQCVTAVAEALLESKHLSGDQLTELIDLQMGIRKPTSRTRIPF
jgi:hypothetical protein